MIPDRHEIPDDVFHALAAGGGGAAAVRHLTAAEYSKHVLLIRGVVDLARQTGHAEAALAREAYELLAAVQRDAPGAAGTVLRHPAVAAWAWRTLRALHRDGPRAAPSPARLGAVAAAAAIRSQTACQIKVPVEDGTVMLPSLGRALLTGASGEALVRCDGAATEVASDGTVVRLPPDPHRDAPHWQALRSVSATAGGRTITLLVDDLDDFRMPGADTTGTRLTEPELATWQALLREAWDLLNAHHWTTADEVQAAVRVLTPLASVPGDQNSGSSRETFGCVALSAPHDARILAATLAHEIQHAKLSALLDVIPLVGFDDGRRYYAPWRDDPRPLSGLLQGAYAYLGVTGFWRRQRHHEDGDAAVQAHAEFARWRAAAHMVAQVIASSGRLTGRGDEFVSGMSRTLRSWRREHVPAESSERARRDAASHRARWNSHNVR